MAMTKKGVLLAAGIWITIAILCALALRYYFFPSRHRDLIEKTGSGSANIAYKVEINFGTDGFPGYAPIRSEAMKREMDAIGAKLTFKDNKGSYAGQLQDLQNGTLQMATFTIDSLIKTSIDLGDMPGTIIYVIDESRGADAIVAYKGAVNSLQDLNTSGSSFILTPDSPSEFLARTVVSSFNMPNLPQKFVTPVDGAKNVLRTLRSADKTKKVAYALWEPYVTQALNDENVHVIIDSSKLTGHIIDVLVVERRFLRDNPTVVRSFIEAYMRVTYKLAKQQDGFLNLIMEDSRKQNDAMTKHQADNNVKGLVWKNTLENYTHFGLVSGAEGGNLPTIDRIISNIMTVLVKTNGVPENNIVAGQEKKLYYDGVLRELQNARFHPDLSGVNILDSAAGNVALDSVRALAELRPLTDDEWRKLVMVGEFRIDPIAFGRGKSTLNSQAQRDLDEVANRLQNFPNYYLIVIGNARSDGDIDVALQLAQERGAAATSYLKKAGVNETRIKSITSRPSGSSGDAQSVTFVVGQLPY